VNQISGAIPTDAQAQGDSPPAGPSTQQPADAAQPDGVQPGDAAQANSVVQPAGTAQAAGLAQPTSDAQAAGVAPPADNALPEPGLQPTGFQYRGRARRRARFLRKARELAYRDLGGLVFNLHRFGARNDALVLAKLTTLAQIDAELRAIEAALGERRPITVLREAGITACARCAAIHGSEDSFCPNCGLSMNRHVDLPIAGAAPPTPPAQPSAPVTAPTPLSHLGSSAAAPAPPSHLGSSAAASAPSPPSAPPPSAPPAAAPVAAVAPNPTGPLDPARAPAPARPLGTPSAPQPVTAAPTGRSPAPPDTSGTRASSPPSQTSPVPAAPIEEDGPTEILRPPVSGS
jgi:hypothetical protein